MTSTVSNPSTDIVLTSLQGDSRPLREWLTTFHLASVILDPYTNESSWILQTASRILHQFSDAAVRTNIVITCTPTEAKTYLGPIADETLVYCDPDRTFVKSLGLSELPAFVLLRSDGTVIASAQGWVASEWQVVANTIAELTAWSRPVLPAADDPGSFKGTPALG